MQAPFNMISQANKRANFKYQKQNEKRKFWNKFAYNSKLVMSKTKIVNFVLLMTLELFLSRVVIKPEFDLVYVMSKLGRYCIISYPTFFMKFLFPQTERGPAVQNRAELRPKRLPEWVWDKGTPLLYHVCHLFTQPHRPKDQKTPDWEKSCYNWTAFSVIKSETAAT